MKMIAIGDNVTDCYIDERLYYPGGNAVNVAVGCARSGLFIKVAYLGIFGDDINAAHLQDALSQEKISMERCRKAYARTCQPGVKLLHGDRVFVRGRHDSVAHLYRLALAKEDLDYLAQYDICHTSCFSKLEEELPILKELFQISFDFSDEWDEAYLAKVCPHLSYAFFSGSHLSEDEIYALQDRCHQYGTSIVGVTRGRKGAIFSHNGKHFHQMPQLVNAVDTMGAGDSFIAGFLSSYKTGHTMEEALDFAAACSAKTCLCNGGFGYPHAFQDDMWLETK